MIYKNDTLTLLAKGKKVLLVDDDPLILDIFRNILGKYFKLIKTAHDGEEAWRIYRKEHFDLVITDIEMPKTNGIMLTKGIRARNRDQSILVSSAYTEEGYLIDLLNIGVDGFVKKPVDPTNLFATITKVLQSIQTKQEKERIRFKKYANLILNRNEEVTKSLYQKTIESKEEEAVKINMEVCLEKIRQSDPQSYEFFQKEKVNLIDSLNDLSDYYDAIVYKNYDDPESFSYLLSSLSKLCAIFSHFESLVVVGELISDLVEMLRTINLESDNENHIEAFDILEFIINDIKKFVFDMFFEENVVELAHFYDALKENISLLQKILQNPKMGEDELYDFS